MNSVGSGTGCISPTWAGVDEGEDLAFALRSPSPEPYLITRAFWMVASHTIEDALAIKGRMMRLTKMMHIV